MSHSTHAPTPFPNSDLEFVLIDAGQLRINFDLCIGLLAVCVDELGNAHGRTSQRIRQIQAKLGHMKSMVKGGAQ